MTQNPGLQGKTIAIIAYFTLIGAIIAISMNMEPKYKFARFHARQAFGLHIVFLGFALFLSQWFHFYIWIGLYIFYFILWLYGFIGALNNKENEVPLLGKYFQNWFTFIQ